MNIIDTFKYHLNAIKTRSAKRKQNDRCIVIGSKGEVGSVLMRILREARYDTIGIDKDGIEKKYADVQSQFEAATFMHVCIPYTTASQFVGDIYEHARKWKPAIIIIHSTVIPGTTSNLQKLQWEDDYHPLFAYSPCRGQHDVLYNDFKRYYKYVASDPAAREKVENHFHAIGLHVSGCDSSMYHWLELSKLMDTSQYGILIAYAQICNRIAASYGVNYQFVRDFMRETNELYQNRPDIYPGYAGGKCIRQNIELMQKTAPHKLWKLFMESNNQAEKEVFDR